MKTAMTKLLDKIDEIHAATHDQQQMIDYIKSLIEATYYDGIEITLVEMEIAQMIKCYAAGAKRDASSVTSIQNDALTFIHQNFNS